MDNYYKTYTTNLFFMVTLLKVAKNKTITPIMLKF